MENSRKKVMHSQARGVIATVYQRMKFEAENGVERVTDARWRTSKAVGEYKQFPTLKSLKKILNEKINYKGCIETLRRLLFDLGYEWINTDDNRRMLSEKHDIQMLRKKFGVGVEDLKFEGEAPLVTISDTNYGRRDRGAALLSVRSWQKSNETFPLVHGRGCGVTSRRRPWAGGGPAALLHLED
ncbi:hypothetical protein EVAR_76591_1 [Eumeta japonica]|uniref:Uncharacterized protein n=1 Tax=Eumeta variegata TaxID=151549 RepID=A0A4C1T509_EUMVA|nr:hypothetical protein EVAR_76591_1 [Eumeta japonica]